MDLRWHRVQHESFEAVRDFLMEREQNCVSACERFLAWNEGPDRLWEGHQRRGAIQSVILLSATGILFPIFRDPEDPDNRKGLDHCLAQRRVRSVQGLLRNVDVAEQILKNQGYHEPERIDYKLMKLDTPPTALALGGGPEGLSFRLASADDASILFPLQAAYEIEEVVPKGSQFKVAASRLALERTLGIRTVLVASLDGKVVGKANTNARAFTRDQIGGVYVLPEFRGRGIATRLVAELCALLHNEGRKVNLFVKTQNTAAQKAYERVGFEAFQDYRIAYFN